MSETRRVLITGVSRFWGGHLARRLEADPTIERIIAVDTHAPALSLERTDFLRADIRYSVIGKLIRTLDIDTVVHAGLIVDPRRASPSDVHETNVIGTMNLVAACSGAGSRVRKLIVKSSTAIYGCEPDDPSFWTESMRRTAPARDTFTRDLDEVEEFVRDFDARRSDAVVTVLRFANVLGPTHDTPFSRLFGLPAVPTVAGFDPRLQFVHEFDAVSALEHAVRHDHPGVFNVAGDGIVLLSQAIAMLDKIDLPVLPFVGTELAMQAADRALRISFPAHLVRLLRYGRVVDTTALRTAFGMALTYTTRDAVADLARRRRVRARRSDEDDLDAFLRARASEWNGAVAETAVASPVDVPARPRSAPRTQRRPQRRPARRGPATSR